VSDAPLTAERLAEIRTRRNRWSYSDEVKGCSGTLAQLVAQDMGDLLDEVVRLTADASKSANVAEAYRARAHGAEKERRELREQLAVARSFIFEDGTAIAQQPTDRLWYVTRCRARHHEALTEGCVWVPFGRQPPPGSAFPTSAAAFETLARTGA